MNSFCENCPHRQVPDLLREKFNALNFKLFCNQPIDDPNIAGCTVKYINIDWVQFANFLANKKLLSKGQIDELRGSGWSISV